MIVKSLFCPPPREGMQPPDKLMLTAAMAIHSKAALIVINCGAKDLARC
jgi:hypothetical protein